MSEQAVNTELLKLEEKFLSAEKFNVVVFDNDKISLIHLIFFRDHLLETRSKEYHHLTREAQLVVLENFKLVNEKIKSVLGL